MNDLFGTPGAVALAAVGLALIALIALAVVLARLRRLQAAQRTVLGDHGAHDLVEHASELQLAFDTLREHVASVEDQLNGRLDDAEQRLDGTIAYRSLVRYDAYNELSGRQSTSIALLDASRSGIVLSSIHHRDQARMYAKQVHEGRAALELSPEEQEAVRVALEGGGGGEGGGGE